MAKIVIELPGEPRGKERPRLGRYGKVYTPKTTADYERSLGWAAKSVFKGEPLTGPVRVTLTAFCGIPVSDSRTTRLSRLANHLRPTKCDLDNVIKIALDSLNGIIWIDDRQVCEIKAVKAYAAVPALRLEIDSLVDSADNSSQNEKAPHCLRAGEP